MLINRQHLRRHFGWFVVTLAVAAVSAAVYWYFWLHLPASPSDRPGGGSWPGLAFGVLGSACMLFAGLFTWRKGRPRSTRLGSARFWMAGHIWLGLLSAPLILFHSGFRMGGLLEQALMWVFGVVIASGVIGLILQQFIPREMKTSIAAESMYQQVSEVCARLRRSADEEVASKCGPLIEPEGKTRPQTELKAFYLGEVRTFLAPEPARGTRLRNRVEADAVFNDVRQALTEDLHETLDRLEDMCRERRDLGVQTRMHWLLHSWLLLHVPLSMALLVLGVIHVVTALWY